MKIYRKLILINSLTLLFNSTCIAQEVKIDSNSRPEIYPSRVDLYKSFRHSRKDIVFFGNSITFWGEWSELLDMPHIKNRGIPGDTTFGLLDRLSDVTKGQPSRIFILIGINDLARRTPDSLIIRNYQRLIRRIRSESPRTKIFFQTMLPTNSSFGKLKNHYKNDQVRQVNLELKALAKDEKVELIDLYAHFADAQGNLPAKYTFDGVHLNKEGYDIWVNVLRKGNYLKK